ncbi:MAG: hypothetical protein KGN33_18035 [Paracoccaceae bacterium]|nr:hypothetical protein [Paracoccaceae bacterium]
MSQNSAPKTDMHRAVAAVIAAARDEAAVRDLVTIVVECADEFAAPRLRLRLAEWAEQQGTTLAEIEAGSAGVSEDDAVSSGHGFISAWARVVQDGRAAEEAVQGEAATGDIERPQDSDMVQALNMLDELGFDFPAFLGMLSLFKTMAEENPPAWAEGLAVWRAVHAGEREAPGGGAWSEVKVEPTPAELAAKKLEASFAELMGAINVVLDMLGEAAEAKREHLEQALAAVQMAALQRLN